MRTRYGRRPAADARSRTPGANLASGSVQGVRTNITLINGSWRIYAGRETLGRHECDIRTVRPHMTSALTPRRPNRSVPDDGRTNITLITGSAHVSPVRIIESRIECDIRSARLLARALAFRDAAIVDPTLVRALAKNPVITRRRHPELAARLARAAAEGRLTRLLPGVYTLPERSQDFATRAAAACRYEPTGVIVGDAAAALSYWPELNPDTIVVTGRHHKIERAGYTFIRRAVPPELIRTRRGIRYTAPALTALDQVEHHGAEGIDRALRSRRATVSQLREALDMLPHRRGNIDRRAALLDSRDGGWSALERKMHRLLRDAGITGWSANAWVETAVGDYVVDIVFHHSPLCIELDGREFHGASKFDDDRLRGNELLLAGRQVLHFTWVMIDRHADLVVSTVQRALAQFGPDAARR